MCRLATTDSYSCHSRLRFVSRGSYSQSRCRMTRRGTERAVRVTLRKRNSAWNTDPPLLSSVHDAEHQGPSTSSSVANSHGTRVGVYPKGTRRDLNPVNGRSSIWSTPPRGTRDSISKLREPCRRRSSPKWGMI